jgi:hypothetical protein
MTIAGTVAQIARAERMLCVVRGYMFCSGPLSLLPYVRVEIERTLASAAIA